MTTLLSLTYCGMEGSGNGVKAAKQDAARKIESLITDMATTPHLYVMQVEGCSALIARTPHGWGYRIIQMPGDPLKQGPVYLNGCDADSDETLVRCAKHLADCAWSFDVDDDTAWIAKIQATMPTVCRNARFAADLLNRFTWQRKYKAARDAGETDENARYIAGNCAHLVKHA